VQSTPNIVKKTFEDTKGVITSRNSKKNRQYNDHRESTKEQTMNYENTTQKTKDCERHEPH